MNNICCIFFLICFWNVYPVFAQDVIQNQAKQDKEMEACPIISTPQAKSNPMNGTKRLEVIGGQAPITKSKNHLQFMGFPIDGEKNKFEENLSTKGFVKSSLGDISGYFYGAFGSVEITENPNTHKVCKVLVRYNQLMANYSEEDIINLYHNMVSDLRKKYQNAGYDVGDNGTVFSLTNGYIYCHIFSTIFGKMGSGINLEVSYVDKANSSKYMIPSLNKYSNDL